MDREPVTEQSRAEQSRAEQSRAEQSRPEQSRPEHRKAPKKRLLIALLALATVASLVFTGNAQAELSTTPQTSWGVQGLLTGTQTDGVGAEVFVLEQVGSAMYVGGRFTEVTDGATATPQVGLAAFDADSGDWISTFAPILDGAVYALQASPDGARLFVGGDFENVNGVATGGLVALDPTTGAIDPTWTGRIGGYNVVRDFNIEGSWLYTAGGFTSISSSAGGNSASRVARFAVSDGAHDSSWRPSVSGGTVWGIAANSAMDRVYLAGSFTEANGAATPGGFVALRASTPDSATGVEPFPINTQNASAQYNFDVVAVNGLVFVAGSQHYVQVLNESDLSLKVFHRSSDRGDYQSLTVAGDRVYGGSHSFGGTTLESANGVLWVGPPPAGVVDAPIIHTATNSWLTAFSATTGLHIDGSPPPIATSGEGIWGITQASDSCIWAGGAVTSVGGTPQWGFTRLCDTSMIDTERPSAPTALALSTSGTDTVDLTWNPSSDNVGVTGYFVYDNVTGLVLAEATDTSAQLIDPGLHDHGLYVKAFDAAGNVSWRSNIQTVSFSDTTRPSTPSNLVATTSGVDSVDLSWVASSDNVAVAGYFVYDQDSGLVLADVVSPTAALTGLSFGTHHFSVKAYDAAGNTSWRSNIASVQLDDPGIDTERPSKPTGLVVDAVGVDTVDLSWNPSSDNVDVAGYRVHDNTTAEVLLEVVTPSGQLIGVVAGTHSYYVKAFDAAGNTSWRSNIVTITVP